MNTAHPRSYRFVAPVVAVVALLSACSSSQAPDGDTEERVTLDGIFRPTAPKPGVPAEIAFRGANSYRLTPADCEETACEETGTFAVDRAGRQLKLVVDGSGKTYSLAFEVVGSAKPSPKTNAGGVTPKSSLTEGDGKLVEGSSSLLVATQVKLLDTEYENTSVNPKPIKYNKTLKTWIAATLCVFDGDGGYAYCTRDLDPKAEQWKENLENQKDLDCSGATYGRSDVTATNCGWNCDFLYEIVCCPKKNGIRFPGNGYEGAYCGNE